MATSHFRFFAMFAAVTSALLLAKAPQANADAVTWTCTATDYQGSYGTGYSDDRGVAESNAQIACQQRSHSFCTVTGCIRGTSYLRVSSLR